MFKKIWKTIVYLFACIGLFLCLGYGAMKLGWTKTSGVIDNQHDYFKKQLAENTWNKTPEWQVLKEAIIKDKEIIISAANKAGVEPRLIVAPLVVEQLRLYTTDREIFKQIFAPLKMLGNQSQFSWGVMGVKQATARQIEENLKNNFSVWYLGKPFESLLDFTAQNKDEERFARLTDEQDRSYSYLYSGLLIKQIEKQWEKAGFPIEDRPDIVATLYNIGFQHSNPNKNPVSGGAEIQINGSKYSFGSLAASFYASNELLREFPRK